MSKYFCENMGLTEFTVCCYWCIHRDYYCSAEAETQAAMVNRCEDFRSDGGLYSEEYSLRLIDTYKLVKGDE